MDDRISWKEFLSGKNLDGKSSLSIVLKTLSKNYNHRMHCNFMKWGLPTLQDAFVLLSIKEKLDRGVTKQDAVREVRSVANEIDWSQIERLFESGSTEVYMNLVRTPQLEEFDAYLEKHEYINKIPGHYFNTL